MTYSKKSIRWTKEQDPKPCECGHCEEILQPSPSWYYHGIPKYKRGHGHGRQKDLKGKKFTMLTVIEKDHVDERLGTIWKCECECGETTLVPVGKLTSRHTQSCGCMKYVDIENGEKFNKLTFLEFVGLNDRNERLCRCVCDCGTETIVPSWPLRNGHTKSCGECPNYKDIEGEKFNMLTAVEFSHIGKFGCAWWKCKCDCGRTKYVVQNGLHTGRTKSCGCIPKGMGIPTEGEDGVMYDSHYESKIANEFYKLKNLGAILDYHTHVQIDKRSVDFVVVSNDKKEVWIVADGLGKHRPQYSDLISKVEDLIDEGKTVCVIDPKLNLWSGGEYVKSLGVVDI